MRRPGDMAGATFGGMSRSLGTSDEPVDGLGQRTRFDKAMVVGFERAIALDIVEVARALAIHDRSWKTETFELADGQAVLLGPSLYVNRVLAAGLETDVTDIQLDLLERRSSAVGVEPAFEINEHTLPSVAPRLAARGFRAGGQTSLMSRVIDDHSPDPDRSVEVEVVGESALAVWQATTADGWGHGSGEARRASDVFAAAAADAQSPGLLLARSVLDRRILGCATLSIRDDLALLGGTSTLPTERGRGVHAALITHRLRMAADAGCTIALAQCAPGGGSERNLVRHGFVRMHTTTTRTRSRK